MCGRSIYKLTWGEIVALRLSDTTIDTIVGQNGELAHAHAVGSRSVLVVKAAQRIEVCDV